MPVVALNSLGGPVSSWKKDVVDAADHGECRAMGSVGILQNGNGMVWRGGQVVLEVAFLNSNSSPEVAEQ